MKLIFVRHGQTDFNLQGRPQGQEVDMPLNATGIAQVEAAAQLVPNDVDFIISSPLKRAAQTAEILNKSHNKRIEYNDDIKELKYGTLAGKLWAEVEEITGDPDVHQKDRELKFDYLAYGGDSAETLRARVKKFIDETKAKYPNNTILVTAHGGVIDSVYRIVGQEVESGNASVHEFEF